MSSKKQEAIDFIQTMPNTASTHDILESLLIKEQIEKGLSDVENGRVISHDEVKKRRMKL